MNDLLPDGTAPLLYAVLVPFAAAFVAGVHRLWRRLGGTGLLAGLMKSDGRSGTDPLRHRRLTSDLGARLRRLLDHGILQRRVVRHRYAGSMHLLVFWGFVVLFVGDLFLLADRYFIRPLGGRLLEGRIDFVFQAALDVAGIAFVAGVLLVLFRRLVWRPPGFSTGAEAIAIAFGLLFIGISGFVIEALRLVLQPDPGTTGAFVGHALAGVLDASSGDLLLATYRGVWWAHAIAAFAFIAALPYTRLAHMIASPIHVAMASTSPPGALPKPFDLRELMESGEFDVTVGAATIEDLGPRDRLSLIACTECARCEESCPATATGTALSPMRVLGRMRRLLRSHGNDGAGKFFDGAVSEQEVWACTMCGACARQCPVLIRPSEHVAQLRRALVARGRVGSKATTMLDNLARTGNPYGLPGVDREDLARDLGVSTLREAPDAEWLYWIGCAATYDPRARAVARATVRVLRAADVSFAILGGEERCTGDPARRIGEEGKFQEMALQNLETLDRHGVRRILTHCAHCFNTFKNEYTDLGGSFEVAHHAAFIRELIAAGRIRPTRSISESVTLHDACYLGRLNGETSAPREVLGAINEVRAVEMRRNRDESFCCGAGGARYWYDSEVSTETRMSLARIDEARSSGARVLVSECPYCLKMFEDGVASAGLENELRVRDLAELVAEAID
jgi:Fe-S oxidoreductase/nitrate reductase gamma subunit